MLIDPAKLSLVLIGLMQQARKKYELMFAPSIGQTLLKSIAILTPELREWDYGDCEWLDEKRDKAIE